MLKKLPSPYQWLQLFKVLTEKEKKVFLGFLSLFLISALFLIFVFYFKNTEVVPARGGSHVEGVVGSPRFINPIYSGSNDVDRDLTEILFSGINDLAEKIEISEDGKLYRVILKDNIFWHDGERLTVDDIIFTIQTIQNADYKSPLRANWLGIKMEKISDQEIHFKLKNSYAAFSERLDVKIIPQHIWQDVSPQNFPLSIYNLKPVGSGPYRFKSLKQGDSGIITSLEMKANRNYFGDPPRLSKITFLFFGQEKDLIEAARRGKLKGFSLAAPWEFREKEFQKISFSLPRYFAVFFNPQKSRYLVEREMRLALNYGTNKQEIIENIFPGYGSPVHSPLLPQVYGFEAPSLIYEFNPEKAKNLLQEVSLTRVSPFQLQSDLRVGSRGQEVKKLQECLSKDSEVYPQGKVTGYFGSQTKKAVIRFQEKYAEDILAPWGFEKGTGIVSKTTRAKVNEICFPSSSQNSTQVSLTLTTVEDLLLLKVAELLKKQWEELGMKVKIESYQISVLEREIIKKRNYEALLFGEVLGKTPDPYPFWHSSQVKDPGLNLAKYENQTVDKLLEKARVTLDPAERKKTYEKIQEIIIGDAPAVFLYRPDYIYFASGEIKGINPKIIATPSQRFEDIENWYIKTKRTWR